ncbi:unnamed protein product [Phaeothamnion confervicola]
MAHLRFKFELQTAAAFMAFFGALSFVPFSQDLVGIVASSNGAVDKEAFWKGTSTSYPAAVLLTGVLIGVLWSVTSVLIAAAYLIYGYFSKALSAWGLIITLGAWFTFWAAAIAPIGFAADVYDKSGTQPWIPAAFEPTSSEVKAVAVMGIMGVAAYAATLIGALTFFHFQFYRYITNQLSLYNSLYFTGRTWYYGSLLLLTGVGQLALGGFVIARYSDYMLDTGNGRLSAPIAIGLYAVSYPQISIVVGLIQILQGAAVWLRCARPAAADKDRVFPLFFVGAFLLTLVLQVYTQLGTIDMPLPQASSAIGVYTIGLSIMPMYLVAKSSSTPMEVAAADYCMTDAAAGDAATAKQGKTMTVDDTPEMMA